MPLTASTSSPACASTSSTSTSASRRKRSSISFMAFGDSARPITARTWVWRGGSSVRRISGRTELGSCQGREVLENAFQSTRYFETCSWRPSIAMFSRSSHTTGASSRMPSSTRRALRTDSALNMSMSVVGIGLLIASSPEREGEQEQEQLQIQEAKALAEFGRRQLRRHRHRTHDLALDDQEVAVALQRAHLHQLGAVGGLDLHRFTPT